VGSKNKLKRFKENETFDNVFQPTREEVVGGEFPLKGKWNSVFFKNDNPIIIELGCGKGEYSVGLAERYPDKNFVGIDIKGARFWRGAKTAVDEGMRNVAFVRTQIELINFIFAENEIDEIWITFPDPQIKYKRTKHRMTNSEFLQLYNNFENHRYVDICHFTISDVERHEALKEILAIYLPDAN
jgi:tRNA (guanine-N7-)-methyltransferase